MSENGIDSIRQCNTEKRFANFNVTNNNNENLETTLVLTGRRGKRLRFVGEVPELSPRSPEIEWKS
jgi:hypothetical protein